MAKYHRAAGHSTNRNLAQIICDAGHPSWKIRVALQHSCPACESLKKGGTSSGQVPPAATHQQFRAWQAVGIDVAEWVPPGKKMKVKFILFMDMATRLRAVQPLFSYDFLQMKAESSEQVIQALSERWLSVFPKPQLLVLNRPSSLGNFMTSRPPLTWSFTSWPRKSIGLMEWWRQPCRMSSTRPRLFTWNRWTNHLRSRFNWPWLQLDRVHGWLLLVPVGLWHLLQHHG